jgi:hypothetical protein
MRLKAASIFHSCLLDLVNMVFLNLLWADIYSEFLLWLIYWVESDWGIYAVWLGDE